MELGTRGASSFNVPEGQFGLQTAVSNNIQKKEHISECKQQ